MNSSYVETDEVQQQWLATAAQHQAFEVGNSVGGFDHIEPQYCPGGYLEYTNLGNDDARAYGCVAYDTRYQQQSPVAWSDPSFDNRTYCLGADSVSDHSSTWLLPHAAPSSSAASSSSYDYQPMSLRVHAVPALQRSQPSGYFDISTIPQGHSAGVPLTHATLSMSELIDVPATPSEKLFHPPMIPGVDGTLPRQQHPRFDGDTYTASWIHGTGVERVGWCGFCPTWHKLKDSAYWYHMHYSHGISCVTGKPFKEPQSWRHKQGTTTYEALCGGCYEWVNIGKPDRWRTPYYRHAYKCQTKTLPNLNTSRMRSNSSSPHKAKLALLNLTEKKCES